VLWERENGIQRLVVLNEETGEKYTISTDESVYELSEHPNLHYDTDFFE